jgi:predicted membrane channel-forming protein YqfA (hemolysin III family)
MMRQTVINTGTDLRKVGLLTMLFSLALGLIGFVYAVSYVGAFQILIAALFLLLGALAFVVGKFILWRARK